MAAILVTVAGLLAGQARAPAQPSSPKQLKRRMDELTEQALKLREQGQHAAATKRLRQAVEICQRLYPKDKYPHGHPDLAEGLNNLAVLLGEEGDYTGAVRYHQRALAMREQLYPEKKYPRGHPEVAQSLVNLGGFLHHQGDLGGALRYLRRALAMHERLYPAEKFPNGHPGLAITLSNLGLLLMDRAEYGSALGYLRRALAMDERLYPKDQFPLGHPRVAQSLNYMGLLLSYRGAYADALDYFRRALRMYERVYPKDKYPHGHPNLAATMTNLGLLQAQRGDYAGALGYHRRALEVIEGLYPKAEYPKGHPYLALAFHNVGQILFDRGDYAGALTYHQKALAMYQRVYPESRYPSGHPEVALSLNSVGLVLKARRDYASAEDYCRRCLAMNERLYPKDKYPQGNPNLSAALTNLGSLLKDRRDYRGALVLFRRALAMDERLYPEDKYPQRHPYVAKSVAQVAGPLMKQGDYAAAERYLQRALALNERLYPKDQYPLGHPDLALSLNDLSALLLARGDYAGAVAHGQRALQMYQDLAAGLGQVSSEAQALVYTASLPRTRDGVLSATRHLPRTDESCYAAVWRGKAAVTRCLERRQRDLLAALASEELPVARRREVRRLWEKLLGTRRTLARLLLGSAAGPEMRRRAGQLSRDKEALEERLAGLLRPFARERELERAGHGALRTRLPAGTIFVDLLRYVDFEQDPKQPGRAGERRTERYVAFVLRCDRPVRRVELGPAGPIENALAGWRLDIGSRRASPAGRHLGRLLWGPLAKHIPAPTRVVLFSPDGALARLPWPALPTGAAGRMLLEHCAVAVVPHGPFLLERLSEPTPADRDAGLLLAVGAVSYDGKPKPARETQALALLRAPEVTDGPVSWPALAGTARELDGVLGRAGKRPTRRLTGVEASTGRLLAELPKARWAHIGTHGFFADARLRSALQLDEKLFTAQGFRGGPPPGARNPLVLSGLVLAGANRPLPKDPNQPFAKDRGILTAEAIAGLPLQNLELAILSACETGLGEVAGGEGVFGLQRAFHLAGAKNVIASLWKVDDQATAALMAVFYNKLWQQKLPASEALRQAQLTLYYHPEWIGALARERGPNFDKMVRLPAGPDKGVKNKPGDKAATKLWAGFVLSGLGR
jgi:CHAT domain-containing protein/tetratricopeptide (TPR) repeat protein